MDQTFVNWLLGGFGALTGFLLNSVWQAVKDLQTADSRLVEKVASIEILVAGEYVRRDAFDEALNRLFAKLERIENKIDHKVDK